MAIYQMCPSINLLNFTYINPLPAGVNYIQANSHFFFLQTFFSKIVKVKFLLPIWSQIQIMEGCIHMSTNKPCIGSPLLEVTHHFKQNKTF